MGWRGTGCYRWGAEAQMTSRVARLASPQRPWAGPGGDFNSSKNDRNGREVRRAPGRHTNSQKTSITRAGRQLKICFKRFGRLIAHMRVPSHTHAKMTIVSAASSRQKEEKQGGDTPTRTHLIAAVSRSCRIKYRTMSSTSAHLYSLPQPHNIRSTLFHPGPPEHGSQATERQAAEAAPKSLDTSKCPNSERQPRQPDKLRQNRLSSKRAAGYATKTRPSPSRRRTLPSLAFPAWPVAWRAGAVRAAKHALSPPPMRL
jgi:hypothetical protein